MKRLALMASCAVLLAAATHLVAVWATPRIVMYMAMSKVAAGEYNALKNAPLATHGSRTIVRPSPDLAYSACVLDLSKGAIRLQIPLTEPYTSLSLYSSTTDNYFVRDDRQGRNGMLDVVVLAPGAEKPAGLPPATVIVRAPTESGMAIVRRVAESPESMPAIDAVRKNSSCTAYPG